MRLNSSTEQQPKRGFAQFGHVEDESMQSSSLGPSAAKLRSSKFNQIHDLQMPQDSWFLAANMLSFLQQIYASGVENETV